MCSNFGWGNPKLEPFLAGSNFVLNRPAFGWFAETKLTTKSFSQKSIVQNLRDTRFAANAAQNAVGSWVWRSGRRGGGGGGT